MPRPKKVKKVKKKHKKKTEDEVLLKAEAREMVAEKARRKAALALAEWEDCYPSMEDERALILPARTLTPRLEAFFEACESQETMNRRRLRQGLEYACSSSVWTDDFLRSNDDEELPDDVEALGDCLLRFVEQEPLELKVAEVRLLLRLWRISLAAGPGEFANDVLGQVIGLAGGHHGVRCAIEFVMTMPSARPFHLSHAVSCIVGPSLAADDHLDPRTGLLPWAPDSDDVDAVLDAAAMLLTDGHISGDGIEDIIEAIVDLTSPHYAEKIWKWFYARHHLVRDNHNAGDRILTAASHAIAVLKTGNLQGWRSGSRGRQSDPGYTAEALNADWAYYNLEYTRLRGRGLCRECTRENCAYGGPHHPVVWCQAHRHLCAVQRADALRARAERLLIFAESSDAAAQAAADAVFDAVEHEDIESIHLLGKRFQALTPLCLLQARANLALQRRQSPRSVPPTGLARDPVDRKLSTRATNWLGSTEAEASILAAESRLAWSTSRDARRDARALLRRVTETSDPDLTTFRIRAHQLLADNSDDTADDDGWPESFPPGRDDAAVFKSREDPDDDDDESAWETDDDDDDDDSDDDEGWSDPVTRVVADPKPPDDQRDVRLHRSDFKHLGTLAEVRGSSLDKGCANVRVVESLGVIVVVLENLGEVALWDAERSVIRGKICVREKSVNGVRVRGLCCGGVFDRPTGSLLSATFGKTWALINLDTITDRATVYPDAAHKRTVGDSFDIETADRHLAGATMAVGPVGDDLILAAASPMAFPRTILVFRTPRSHPLAMFGSVSSTPAFRLRGHTTISDLQFSSRRILCSISTSFYCDSIKIWDLDVGFCLHTIRNYESFRYEANIRIAADDPILFVANAKLGTAPSQGPPTVHVWTLPPLVKGSGKWMMGRPRFTCLLQGDQGTIGSMAVVPSLRLLVVSHDDVGYITLWRYDRPQPQLLRRVALSKEKLDSNVEYSPTPPALQIARDGRTFFVNTRGTVFRVTLDRRDDPPFPGGVPCNCANCGAYVPGRSKTCSACHAVRFCDTSCLQKGWPAHKSACLAARARSRATHSVKDDGATVSSLSPTR